MIQRSKTTKLAVTLTTIQPPTNSTAALSARIGDNSFLVVAGDSKGPCEYKLTNTTFLSLQAQCELQHSLSPRLPVCHYSRKNIAYLEAIRQQAELLYETDDDNAPMDVWAPREKFLPAGRLIQSVAEPRWVNVYRYFTEANIWPRGLPLEAIHGTMPETHVLLPDDPVYAPIQQGLVNNSPDVDAIWRLVMDRKFSFDDNGSIVLGRGNWCPFNTQSTWWWPEAYPLLYIPSHCSFRMCDIWKSFVAQRCIWEIGGCVAFHPPEVYQERNVHNLIKDFEDEIPGYTRNAPLCNCLSELCLKAGLEVVGDNLLTCYQALVHAGFFPEEELKLVEAWLEDVGTLS